MTKPITASMLYDYVQCPHRVYLDLFGDPERRDPISAFVQQWHLRVNSLDRFDFLEK
jgi:predicted RecB family nuclease